MPLPIELQDIFKHKQKSYKMVLILCLLDELSQGQLLVPLERIKQKFLAFFQEREAKGLPVDVPPSSIGTRWSDATPHQIQSVVDTPIQALSNVLEYDQRAQALTFRPYIAGYLQAVGMTELRELAQRELDNYHNNLVGEIPLREHLQTILSRYIQAKSERFAEHDLGIYVRQTIKKDLEKLPFISEKYKVQGSVGQGNWANIPWIAIMDKRITEKTQKGVYIVYLFSEDMSAAYLTLIQGVTEPIQTNGRPAAYAHFREQVRSIREQLGLDEFIKDENIYLTDSGLGRDYQVSTIAYSRYDREKLPSNRELLADLKKMLEYYETYVELELSRQDAAEQDHDTEDESTEAPMSMHISDTAIATHLHTIKTFIRQRGFQYPDHLIENFYLSLKTKPFVILAGISGTGKTKLVKLFAEAVGATSANGQFRLIPVRTDWSDPSDLIGYKDLSGTFRPGPLTEVLVEAYKPENRQKPYFICLDEMNVARVEHYFSDVLSLMETQERQNDRIVTDCLIPRHQLGDADLPRYGSVHFPDNVFLIGTVNMDETTHPFSKKVLDRGNTIEFHYIELDNFPDTESLGELVGMQTLPALFFTCDYLTLQEAYAEYTDLIKRTTEKLVKINHILEGIHAHVGFRVRDAICFYLIYNQRFGLLSEEDAFDLQLSQKILPRIQGSSMAVKRTILQLLRISLADRQLNMEEMMSDASPLYEQNVEALIANARYKHSTQKLLFMLRRLEEDGFTSFWIS